MKYFYTLLALCLLISTTTTTLADTWQQEKIDGSVKIGRYNAVTIDDQDNLHIVSYDSENMTLEYLFENNGDWQTEIIAEFDQSVADTSIVLDATGSPHIAFHDYSIERLVYARKKGDNWVRIPVISDVANITSTAIVMDSSGNPHVCYGRGDRSILGCAHYNGSTWAVDVIDNAYSPFGFGSSFGFAIDSQDALYVAYISRENQELRFASKTGANWNKEVVDTYYIDGSFSDLILDSSNRPHIAYTTRYEDGMSLKMNLRYAKKTVSGWQIEEVDDENSTGEQCSIGLTPGGNPVFSYYDLGNEDVLFANENGSTWQKTILEEHEDVGSYMCMALTGNGLARVVYYDGRNSDILISYQTQSGWDQQRPFTSGYTGRYQSVDLDTNGYPHIAYSGGMNNGCKYTYYDGSQWLFDEIPADNCTAKNICLQLDSQDYPHIICGIETTAGISLRYVYKDASGWHIEAAGISDRFCLWSFCLDSQDKPHLCYQDNETDFITYSHKNGAQWVKNVIMQENGDGNNCSLALDSSDVPCAAFFADYKLTYAKHNGSTWNIHVIESIPAVVEGLDLALDLNDLPHISFATGFGNGLRHAWFDGSSWTSEVIASTSTFGGESTIDIGSNGTIHVISETSGADGFNYLVFDGEEWVKETLSVNGGMGVNSLILNPNNVPFFCYGNGYICYTVKLPETTGVAINFLGNSHILPGDPYACTVNVSNSQILNIENYPLFVLLEAYGMYFFAPSFNPDFDHYLSLYPRFMAGHATISILPEFIWPTAGSGGATWYAAMTTPEMTELFGEMDIEGFTWSE